MWRHKEGNSNNKIQGKNAKIHHHHHPYQGQGQGQGQGHLRSWMVVNREGSSQTVEVGKHAIMRRSGLPARDLRMLEPALSHPSTILGRERAIVFNVEHIKAIITAHELLLLNSPHPAVAPFARQLLYRLFASPSSPSQPSAIFKEGGARNTRSNTKESHSKNSESPGRPFLRDDQHTNLTDTGNRSSKVLPFEFRALEVFLEEACNCLDRETSTLEKEAYPALDELTITVSTLNLERVRQIKSRLVAISGRIQKVRDELEHLLDDEGDMAEMYLTNKVLQQQLEERSLDHRELPNESKPADVLHNDSASGAGSRSQRSEVDEDHASKHFDVAELEMLLEAYFVQTDGTLNKLSTLRQYVDNTEDYINIMLDDKQNQLLQMGVMLSTVNLLLNVCIVAVGIMGMNIHIKLFETGLRQFIATASGVVVGFFTLYGCAIAWYKKKHLIE